jgi:DNA-binding CsgD family transcriptional regulator
MALVLPATMHARGSLTSTEMLADLVRRSVHDDEIHGAFATIASYCGFDGLSYLLLADTAAVPTVMHHWTNAGAQWRARYTERQYQAADPRIVLTQGRRVPVLWRSAHSFAERPRAAFAQDAARHGLQSGVAISFDDARIGRIVLSWDCADSRDDTVGTQAIRDQLGALVLLAGHLHEAMLDHCRAVLAARPHTRLTPRERECVSFAARGMTSADIGAKLGITERTVNFHFGNITTKLGVLNRAEAIVRALALHAVPPV